MKKFNSILFLSAAMMFSSGAFAAKPDGVGGGKPTDKVKKEASADRLCRTQIIDQIKALPKGQERKDQIKPLIEQLKACNSKAGGKVEETEVQ